MAAVFLIEVSCCTYSYPASGELSSCGEFTAKDTAAAEETIKKKEIPWSGTFYVAGGIGNPYVLRFEAGFNIGRALSIALNAGQLNTDDQGIRGAIGLLLKINIPLSYKFSPYLLLGTGREMPFSGANYSFKIVGAGLRITAARSLQLNTEFGFTFIKTLFNGEGYLPDRTFKKTSFGFNVALEIDVRQLF